MSRMRFVACLLVVVSAIVVCASCGAMMGATVAAMWEREETVKPKIKLRKIRVAVVPFSSSYYKYIGPFECQEGVLLAEAVENRLREKLKSKKVTFVVTQPARKYFRSTRPGEEDYKELAELLDCDVIIHGEILKVENKFELARFECTAKVWAYDARDNTMPVKEEVWARYPEVGTLTMWDMDDLDTVTRNLMAAAGNASARLFHKYKARRELGTEKLMRPELR